MKQKFDVTGMTCAACSARVEKVTAAVPGVQKAEVNLLAGSMTVEIADESVCAAIEVAVKNAGYGASRSGMMKKKPEEDPLKPMKIRIIGSAIFLVVLMYFTMGHMVGLPVPHWYHDNPLTAALWQLVLTVPVLCLNRSYFSRGLKSLWHRSANMDSLIAVGSGAALIYGVAVLFLMSQAMGRGDLQAVKEYGGDLYFESSAMILTLVTLGKFLETRAKGKTGDAIRRLMDLRPQQATVLRNGVQIELPIDQVRVGDTVVVRSGCSIPVDGTVIKGRAAVDQSAITGESLPVEMAEGDAVTAATTVTEGYLEFEAQRIGEDTTLAQIIRMVEEAGGSKAPIARLADKIAGIFVPAVMSIAAVVFLIWMLAGQTLEFSLTSAISVLVISCPCALGLATPVAIMVGTGKSAEMGILFKSAAALEQLHQIDTVVLDKTGTLTTGKPAVTDVLAQGDRERLLQVAAALEARSEHPFAKAIMDFVGQQAFPEATEFETLPGMGVAGTVNGVRCCGGNRRLMAHFGIEVPEDQRLAAQGKTPLYFAEGNTYLGAIAAADVLKADSAAAVAAMKKLRLQVVMLTGDNSRTAETIASTAGIDQVIADVLPGDKANVVKSLQSQGKKVLMVGDGINDAPALATADLGMAIGAGTDIAIDSAQIVLMNGSVSGVTTAVELSRATVRNIKQNLFWAFFYNALCIPIAAGALYPALGWQLSPMLGAAAMSLSSVFVVSNALRLRFFKSKTASQPAAEEIIIKEEPKMETIIKVGGMMCPHCKAMVEKVCKTVPGTQDAVVDLTAKTVTVTGDADVSALKQVIIDAGYEILP